MKFLVTIKNTFVLLAVVLLNSLTFVGHSAAMCTMSHEMSGMSHNSTNASSCATLCRTAIINKEEYLVNDDESEDDTEPAIPFYSLDKPLQTDEKSLSQHLYAAEIKPPPKIPIYILHSVFRV